MIDPMINFSTKVFLPITVRVVFLLFHIFFVQQLGVQPLVVTSINHYLPRMIYVNGNFYHLKVLVLDVASPACLESPGRA